MKRWNQMSVLLLAFICFVVCDDVSCATASWSPVRVSGYGPVMVYQSPVLSLSVPLVEAGVWRSRRIDPSGFYYLGARYYDPTSGRFASADPLGHATSMDLYSFANGDPMNNFDATGRFGAQMGGTAWAEDTADIGAEVRREQNFIAAASGVVDLIPIVGGIKQWAELNTGYDLFTGERIDENQYAQAGGIVLNFMAFLPMTMEVGAEAYAAAVETEVVETEIGGAMETEAANVSLMNLAAEAEEVEVAQAEATSSGMGSMGNYFNASGQGEFGFMQGMGSAPAQSMAQPTALESGSFALQEAETGIQQELNFNPNGQFTSAFAAERANQTVGTIITDPARLLPAPQQPAALLSEYTSATRACWTGDTTGLPAAQASGASVLQLSATAQAAFNAGNPALMINESTSWAAGATGETAPVFVGSGAGRTFWSAEFPQLMNNLNNGSLNSITFHF